MSVVLDDKFVTFGEFTEEMNEAISVFEINAKMLDFKINTIRFGNVWEMEVIIKEIEETKTGSNYKVYKAFNIIESFIIRVRFDKKNEAQSVSIFYENVQLYTTRDFKIATDAIKEAAIRLVKINDDYELAKQKSEEEKEGEEEL